MSHEPDHPCGTHRPRFPYGPGFRTLSSVTGERLWLVLTTPESNRHPFLPERNALPNELVVLTEEALSLVDPILLRTEYHTPSPPVLPRTRLGLSRVSRPRRAGDLRSWTTPSAGTPRTFRSCPVLGVAWKRSSRCRAALTRLGSARRSFTGYRSSLASCRPAGADRCGLAVHGVPRSHAAAGVIPPFTWSPRVMSHAS